MTCDVCSQLREKSPLVGEMKERPDIRENSLDSLFEMDKEKLLFFMEQHVCIILVMSHDALTL